VCTPHCTSVYCTEVTELLIFVQSVLYQKCLFCYRAVGHSTLKTGLERSHCLGLENDRAICKNQGCGCWCRVWNALQSLACVYFVVVL